MIFICKYNNKTQAFTFFETIILIILISLCLNITFIYFKKFKENQSIIEAKLKINDAFLYSSINSLNSHKEKKLQFNLVTKKIFIVDDFFKNEREFSLPKNLIYYSTLNSSSYILNLNFTKNGNISQSFSIYIFDRKKNARYKISFYGFDRSKFLKINNYKHIGKNNINLSEIFNYHITTNEDRESFYRDWRKEWNFQSFSYYFLYFFLSLLFLQI